MDGPRPALLAYPKETMIAEKFEAMVRLGMANSRMKDIYDVWLLSRQFAFDGSVLTAAIRNTFRRRMTTLPEGTPAVFSEEFHRDSQKLSQWNAFIRKSKPGEVSGDLARMIGEVSDFLMPIISSVREGRSAGRHWPDGGPWG